MTRRSLPPEKFHRLFYPQVPIVVSVKHENRIGGMPAIWCMPTSFKPQLIALAIAPDHETYRMISAASNFALNWLDHRYAKQVGKLGNTSARQTCNKLLAVGLTTIEGEKTGQPLIQEASAVAECTLLENRRTGTHELIIAEVASASADHFSDYWNFDQYDPILYAGTGNHDTKAWDFRTLRRKESSDVSQRTDPS